jgi:hypothetical protein
MPLSRLKENGVVETTISTTNPLTGTEYQVPPELGTKVRRAAEILEAELGELTERFSIKAHWQFLQKSLQGETAFIVQLDLTAEQESVREFYTSPLDSFRDDAATRRSIQRPMWIFGRALSAIVKSDLARIERALESLSTSASE